LVLGARRAAVGPPGWLLEPAAVCWETEPGPWVVFAIWGFSAPSIDQMAVNLVLILERDLAKTGIRRIEMLNTPPCPELPAPLCHRGIMLVSGRAAGAGIGCHGAPRGAGVGSVMGLS